MREFKIGSIRGVPISLHLTFLVILPIFSLLLGSQVAEVATFVSSLLSGTVDGDVLAGTSLQWVVGIVATVGLFTSVLLHEFGHAIVAQRYGYTVSSIKLWIFGGVASIEETPDQWTDELHIALAGPVVSVGLSGLCYGAFLLSSSLPVAVQFVLGYLTVLNAVLAAFNMLPGFPLDGGRVLRAFLARGRSYARATQIAAEVGKNFAVIFFMAGLILFTSIPMAGLAVFVYIGAVSESQQTRMEAAFDGITVADVMTAESDLEVAEPDESVREIGERMVATGHSTFPVRDGHELVGMVTAEDVTSVADPEMDAYHAEDVMADDLSTVQPESPVMDALPAIKEGAADHAFVTTENGDLAGYLSKSDVMTAFKIIKLGRNLTPREALLDGRTAVKEPPSEWNKQPE